jgi:hypothetical protein
LSGDERPDGDVVMATVYLRSATGRALLDAPPDRLTDAAPYRPAPATVARAVDELTRRGFRVEAAGLTLSVSGSPALFERECGVTLTRVEAAPGDGRGVTWRSSSPVMHLAGLEDVIEGVTLAVPAAPLAAGEHGGRWAGDDLDAGAAVHLGRRQAVRQEERETMAKARAKAKSTPRTARTGAAAARPAGRGNRKGGVLFKGPDGTLYLITEDELQRFALTSKEQALFKSRLQRCFAGAVKTSLGVSASDSVSASDGVLP